MDLSSAMHSVDRFFPSCVQSFSSRRYGKRRRARDCGIDKRIEWQQVNSATICMSPERGVSAGHQRELFQLLRQTRPVSDGENGARDDCLQYAGVAGVVGWEEAPPRDGMKSQEW